jgi:drug/metabolite transporter (DMT)-like permease
MTLFVFLLVLFAAVTHALWNYFAKRVSGNFAIMWQGLWAANLALLPASVLLVLRGGFPVPALPYIAASAAAHALYFFTLMRSYELAEISSAYPVARGLGVAGTALIALAFLHERVSTWGGAGILAICVGVLAIGLEDAGTRAGLRLLVWPVLVGACTVSYSVVDKVGVAFSHPVVYINLMLVLSLLMLTPFVVSRYGSSLRATWKANWRASVLVGCGMLGTYLLILVAFRMERASYIVAVREFSVVIAALLGFVLLKERVTPGKAAGIAAITVGLLLIRIG